MAKDSPEFACPGTVLAIVAQQSKSAMCPDFAAFAAAGSHGAETKRNKCWLTASPPVGTISSCNARTPSAIANL